MSDRRNLNVDGIKFTPQYITELRSMSLEGLVNAREQVITYSKGLKLDNPRVRGQLERHLVFIEDIGKENGLVLPERESFIKEVIKEEDTMKTTDVSGQTRLSINQQPRLLEHAEWFVRINGAEFAKRVIRQLEARVQTQEIEERIVALNWVLSNTSTSVLENGSGGISSVELPDPVKTHSQRKGVEFKTAPSLENSPHFAGLEIAVTGDAGPDAGFTWTSAVDEDKIGLLARILNILSTPGEFVGEYHNLQNAAKEKTGPFAVGAGHTSEIGTTLPSSLKGVTRVSDTVTIKQIVTKNFDFDSEYTTQAHLNGARKFIRLFGEDEARKLAEKVTAEIQVLLESQVSADISAEELNAGIGEKYRWLSALNSIIENKNSVEVLPERELTYMEQRLLAHRSEVDTRRPSYARLEQEERNNLNLAKREVVESIRAAENAEANLREQELLKSERHEYLVSRVLGEFKGLPPYILEQRIRSYQNAVDSRLEFGGDSVVSLEEILARVTAAERVLEEVRIREVRSQLEYSDDPDVISLAESFTSRHYLQSHLDGAELELKSAVLSGALSDTQFYEIVRNRAAIKIAIEIRDRERKVKAEKLAEDISFIQTRLPEMMQTAIENTSEGHGELFVTTTMHGYLKELDAYYNRIDDGTGGHDDVLQAISEQRLEIERMLGEWEETNQKSKEVENGEPQAPAIAWPVVPGFSRTGSPQLETRDRLTPIKIYPIDGSENLLFAREKMRGGSLTGGLVYEDRVREAAE